MMSLSPDYETNRFDNGFTLVEILIALAMSSLVISAIYTTYTKQQEVHTVQGQIVQMQQNLRAGISVLTREVRMAGYDPQQTKEYGVTAASATSFSFTSDSNEDGGTPGAGESFQYELYDSDGDGTNDALRRTAGGSALANDIYAINFIYLLSDGTRTSTPADLTKIRGVQVSLLARAANTDLTYQDTDTYSVTADTNNDGTKEVIATWGPYNDHYRRRFFMQEIACRNLGL